MNHFNPLQWTIELNNYHSTEFLYDGLARASFIHEYIHYIQFLISSLGRIFFSELVRNIILAGVHKHYNGVVPEQIKQIDLLKELEHATPGDFVNTDVQMNFSKNYYELRACLDDKFQKIQPTSARFISLPLHVDNHPESTIQEFLHLVINHDNKTYALPITDRVIFENMARQIQRNYLFFTTGDTADIDNLQGLIEEQTYLCLWRLLDNHSRGRYDSRQWIIVLCQISLLCERPCEAFRIIYEKIIEYDIIGLDDLIKLLKRDADIAQMYDQPSMQEIVNELISKLGTIMRIPENGELHEIVKYAVEAHNIIAKNHKYFADPLLTWNQILSWLRSFGRPPVKFKDRVLLDIEGIKTSKPFYVYLELGSKLLLGTL